MNKDEKIKIVERLVNEKHLTFSEGLALMETEKEYVYYPNYGYPSYPVYPTDPWYGRDRITCGLTVGDNVAPLTVGNNVSPLTFDNFTGKQVDTTNWAFIN